MGFLICLIITKNPLLCYRNVAGSGNRNVICINTEERVYTRMQFMWQTTAQGENNLMRDLLGIMVVVIFLDGAFSPFL